MKYNVVTVYFQTGFLKKIDFPFCKVNNTTYYYSFIFLSFSMRSCHFCPASLL